MQAPAPAPLDLPDRPGLQSRVVDQASKFPWWLLFVLLAGAFLAYNFTTNATYSEIFNTLIDGLLFTLRVTLTAYIFAVTIGLFTALGQLSRNVFVQNLAMLYVQVIRGVPIIVQIYYVAFVLVPAVIGLINLFGGQLHGIGLLPESNPLTNLSVRDVGFEARGIIALSISYGAFSSEIFRAGIQSIEKGQVEAALSLGLTRTQALRLIVLPQAIRRVLPPLGNDFVAMLKESSLLSVLGVGEITHLGRKYAASSFRFVETYNTLAFLYLSMTLILSMGVRFLETRLRTRQN